MKYIDKFPPVINNFDGTYTLTGDFVLSDDRILGKGNSLTIPAGFVTDYASVPWPLTLLIPRDGKHSIAAVVHDYLYSLVREGEFTRSVADAMFLSIMRELGVNPLKRYVMYAAVRVAGWAVVLFGKKKAKK